MAWVKSTFSHAGTAGVQYLDSATGRMVRIRSSCPSTCPMAGTAHTHVEQAVPVAEGGSVPVLEGQLDAQFGLLI
jgi:hypothetical protein